MLFRMASQLVFSNVDKLTKIIEPKNKFTKLYLLYQKMLLLEAHLDHKLLLLKSQNFTLELKPKDYKLFEVYLEEFFIVWFHLQL